MLSNVFCPLSQPNAKLSLFLLMKVETLYEESEDTTNIVLTNVKGIGKGTAESLENEGIAKVEELLKADPEGLSSKISGISPKKVSEWQNSAKTLIKT